MTSCQFGSWKQVMHANYGRKNYLPNTCTRMRMRNTSDKMEAELKKAEDLSNKDPEQAMGLLSAIGM